jgi:hypothetical protein
MRNDFFNYLIKDKVMYLVDTNYKRSNKSLETLITIKEDVLEDKDFNIDFIFRIKSVEASVYLQISKHFYKEDKEINNLDYGLSFLTEAEKQKLIDYVNTTTRKMGLDSPIESLGENKKITTTIQKRNKDLTLEKNIMKYTIVKHLAINGVSDFKDLDFINKTEVIEKIYQLGPDPLIQLIKKTDSNEWGDNFDLLYGV